MGERGRKLYPLTNSVNGNPKERRNAKKKEKKKKVEIEALPSL